MCQKAKHATRSRKTYARRMSAARYYCNYCLNKAERMALMERMRAAYRKKGA